MTGAVQTPTKSLNDAQRDWLKKIATALNVRPAGNPFPDSLGSTPDGVGLFQPGQGLNLGNGGNGVVKVDGLTMQEQTAKSAPTPAASARDESTYRGNLSGILDRLNKALAEKPQDTATKTAHDKLRNVYDRMSVEEFKNNFVTANKLLEELLPLLNEYEKTRDAYKAQQEAAKKKHEADEKLGKELTKVHAKYEIVKENVDDLVNHELKDFELTSLTTRAKTLYDDYHRLYASIAVDTVNPIPLPSSLTIESINAVNQQLDEITPDLTTKLTEVKAAYSKNVADIDSQLRPYSDDSFRPGDPIIDVRKRLIDARDKLKTISSYVLANALVDEFKRKIPDHQKYKAEAEKKDQKDREDHKRAQAAFDADMKALKAQLDKTVDSPYPPAADPKSAETLDQLKKWKTEWDAAMKQSYGFPYPSWKYGSGFATQGVAEIKELLKSLAATSTAFWKSNYETSAKTTKPLVDAALDAKKWTDDTMKLEREKVLAKKKELDAALPKQDYYDLSLKDAALHKQAYRFNQLVYRPDKTSLDVAKPRLIGRPVVGPASTTLLMLMDQAGKNPTTDKDGVKLNSDGAAVLTKWEEFSKLEQSWKSKLDHVQKNATKGTDDLKKIDKLKEAIAAATRDAAGKELRDAIAKYAERVDNVESKFRDIKSKIELVNVAIQKTSEAIVAQHVQEKEREVKNKEQEVQDKEKEIADRKAKVAMLVSIGASVCNPYKWYRVGISAAVFIGEQVVEEVIPTGNLQDLQRQLGKLKADLEHIQDALALSKIETAAMEFEHARNEVARAKSEVVSAVEQAQTEETNVVELMQKSYALRAAGEMISKRQSVTAAAVDAEAAQTKYMDESPEFRSEIAALGQRYQGFASANSPAGEDAYKNWLQTTATQNAETLADFAKYLIQTRQLAVKGNDYLSNSMGKYMAGYDQLPRALRSIVRDRNKK
jgi:hypothetical protein